MNGRHESHAHDLLVICRSRKGESEELLGKHELQKQTAAMKEVGASTKEMNK